MQAVREGPRGLLAAEAGTLLIADLSGYTAYLAGTELEHANDVVADLLSTVIAALVPPFHLAEVEGDAVAVYALDGEVDGQGLLDTIDATYFAFRRRVRDVTHATACACEACRRIPDLDLKFVAHHGQFVRQRVAGVIKPAGANVILVHRLLKNSVVEQHHLRAYALLSDACVAALDIDADALGLLVQHERHDDVGDVACCVLDLDSRWRDEQERDVVRVEPDRARFALTRTFAVPAATLWDHLTDPSKRLAWQADLDGIEEVLAGGRRGQGTTTHCAHGKGIIVEEVLDWRPFRSFTVRMELPMLGPWELTNELVPVDADTTELRFRAAGLRGMRGLLWPVVRRQMVRGFDGNLQRLEAVLGA